MLEWLHKPSGKGGNKNQEEKLMKIQTDRETHMDRQGSRLKGMKWRK